MSSKSKRAFYLLLAFVSLLSLLSVACDDTDGTPLTINKIVEGEKQNWSDVSGSVTGDGKDPKVNVWGEVTGEDVCIATGGKWSKAINACKK